MDASSNEINLSQILNYLKNLESRISRLENLLNLENYSIQSDIKIPQFLQIKSSDKTDKLELQIGQFWFAKSGIVILALGIIFLLTFPYNNLPPLFPIAIGYVMVSILILLSYYWRKNYAFVSKYLFGGGLLLLYFTTLRLHFFGTVPLIENLTTEIILLIFTNIIYLIASYKRKSSYLSSLGITLLLTTALISNEIYFITSALLFSSILTVLFKNKFNWEGFYTYSIFLIYFTFFLMFINNPLLGNEIHTLKLPYITVISLLIYAFIISVGNLFRDKTKQEDYKIIISTMINCAGSYGLFLIITVSKFKELLPLSHFIASIVFLLISILFWVKEKSKYSTFFYSLLGYFALSVAIISKFTLPNFFIWLCWQSLLVVSTAIWFRSKFIVVANFIIYLLLFIAYLILAGRIGWVSLSFGFVALLSARILNWQKDRLELKTEKMRIAYLVTAFFMFPYALYHIIPQQYVSLSWIGVALFYYLMSKLLNNKKYRWMALLTLVLTIIYVLIIGITMLEPSYRIISFLALGIVLIITSILYTKFKLKEDTEKEDNENKNVTTVN
ncbi:hypothetical protein ABRY23_12995 [Melioribacteraceae bacterium 4301-Me]|uniref:hypothetical protein n=1 Tax=Pyranulibacter aquaticus TaxID=3163344 RepID=UPI003595CCDE